METVITLGYYVSMKCSPRTDFSYTIATDSNNTNSNIYREKPVSTVEPLEWWNS